MRKLVYYVASTIDGYIAAPDGDASAFPISEAYIQHLAQEFPETFPGHVRSAL